MTFKNIAFKNFVANRITAGSYQKSKKNLRTLMFSVF